MSQLDKILIKIKNNPKSVTFDDMTYFLSALGYNKDNKGKTSGSRVFFIKESEYEKRIIMLHKPHPQKEMKAYAVRQVIDQLKGYGEIQ